MSVTENQQSGQRDRSPSFPFIPLKTAIERLRAFEDFHKRAYVVPGLLGPAWGMKANSSQALQTLAALRAFGLLETVITGEGRKVGISDQGRTYLRAQQETIKRELAREFALRPKQVRIYWGKWGADRPADPACLDELCLNGGFSEDGAEKFLRVYDDTMAFAGVRDSDNIQPEEEVDSGDPGEQAKAEEQPARQPFSWLKPSPSVSGKVPIMDRERVVFTEEGQPNQYLKLIASGELDDVLLEALEDFVKRQRKRLGRVVSVDTRIRDPEEDQG